MEHGQIQTDEATRAYFQSNIGKLRQYSRIRLQWLCQRLGIKFDAQHTPGEQMISEILATGITVPEPHEVKKPQKGAAAQETDPVATQATEPEPPAAQKVSTLEETPHDITNLFQLRKFMAERGFEFDRRKSTRAELLALWDNREAA